MGASQFLYKKTELDSCTVKTSEIGNNDDLAGSYSLSIESVKESELIVRCLHQIKNPESDKVIIEIDMYSIFEYTDGDLDLDEINFKEDEDLREYLTRPVLLEISLLVGVLSSKMFSVPIIEPVGIPDFQESSNRP